MQFCLEMGRKLHFPEHETTFWGLLGTTDMQYLKQAWINENEDGTALGNSCWPMGKYGLHQEAQEILPSSQYCCCARDAIAGPEGVTCASGKELRNKAASRFQIAVSSSLDVPCCTSSLHLASREFYFQFYEDVGAQPNYLALGNCTAVVTPLPKNARKGGVEGRQ